MSNPHATKRFRLLRRTATGYLMQPGAVTARHALDALRERHRQDGHWLAICEDGTYSEFKAADGEYKRLRGAA